MNDIDLYVISHAKTIFNEEKLYCGKTDLKLSKNGIMKYPNCKLYYTSGENGTNQASNLQK